MKSKSHLNMFVATAINEALSYVCSSAAPSVLYFLEKNGSIESKTRIDDLEKFAEGLESIFGFGAKVIEKKILDIMHVKLQLPKSRSIQDDFEFAEEMKRILELYGTRRKASRTIEVQRADRISLPA